MFWPGVERALLRAGEVARRTFFPTTRVTVKSQDYVLAPYTRHGGGGSVIDTLLPVLVILVVR